MKSLSFTGYFILNLLFALVLSAALSLLIIPPYSPNIENLLTIASEAGQIQATAVWDDYLSQKRELAYQLAKKRLVVFSIVFLVLIPVCWRVVTRRILPDSLKKKISRHFQYFFFFPVLLSLFLCFGCGASEGVEETADATYNPLLNEPDKSLLNEPDKPLLRLKDKDWEKLKGDGWIALTDEEVEELINLVVPHEGNRRSLEEIRKPVDEEKECRFLDRLRRKNPYARIEHKHAALLRRHGAISEVDTIADFLRKLELRLPITAKACHAYIEAYLSLYDQTTVASTYEFYAWLEAVNTIERFVEEASRHRLEKYREARAEGISFYDIKWDDDKNL